MLGTYEKKLDEFTKGKTFTRLPHPVRDRADAWCDACGSLEPRMLFGLKEEGTGRYCFVGAECLKEVSRRGVIKRGFCYKSAPESFAEEMATRKLESGVVDTVQPMPEISCRDSTPACSLTPLQAQVHFFRTDESYIALVQVWHQGMWVWGSGEAPRFRMVWEPDGGSGAILRQVLRNRSDAMAECARIASDNALSKLAVPKAEQANLASPPGNGGNGSHDWTGFWKAVRDLGLGRQEVLMLTDSVSPQDWLAQHPGDNLQDLLEFVRLRWEQRQAPPSPAAVESS